MAFSLKMTADETRNWLAAEPGALNQPNKVGLTPLVQLVIHNNVEATKALLDSGVSPNATFDAVAYDRVVGAYRPKPGQWPLSVFAGYHRAAGTLSLLLERGATIPSEYVATVLENIAGGRPHDIAARLVKTLLHGNALANPQEEAAALLNAAQVGNQLAVEVLLEAGVPITAQGARQQTVTHAMIGPGRTPAHNELLGRLLERGAPTKLADQQGHLPLALALRHGAFEAALLLLRAGSPEAGRLSKKNVEPLARAVERARAIQTSAGPAVDLTGLFIARAWDEVAALTEAGMSIEFSLSLDGKVKAPFLEFLNGASQQAKVQVLPFVDDRQMMLATVAGRATTTEGLALLEAALALGDDFSSFPDRGGEMLEAALAANAPLEALESILARGASVNGVGRYRTPAHSAARYRTRLEWLAQKGAELDRPIGSIGTPLQFAIESGWFDGVAFLVKSGAKLDVKDAKGRTPLERAIEKGAGQEVIDVLSAGSPKPAHRPPPPVRKSGRSDLTLACARGDVTAVRKEIARGAKPDARDFRGSTPLAVAAALDQGAVVDALIELGARPDTRTEDGLSPWALAKLLNATKAEKRLVAAGASTDPALLTEAQNTLERYGRLIDEGDLTGFAKAIDGGMEFELPLLGGLLPIHRVIAANQDELLEVVIRAGADVELDSGDRTPLMRAAELGHVALVERLLAAHANKKRVSSGWNASGFAKRAGHEAVVKLIGLKPQMGDTKPRKPAKPKGPKLEMKEGRVMVLVNAGFTDQDEDMPFWFDHDNIESLQLEPGADVATVLRAFSYGESFADEAAAAIAKLRVVPRELFVLYEDVLVLRPGPLPAAWHDMPGIYTLDGASYAGDFAFVRTRRG